MRLSRLCCSSATHTLNIQCLYIQLCKADLNFILHTIWGHRLIRHALYHRGLDPAQYALPGHMCNNAVLNKTLFLDLSRQTLSPGILSDYDATAAFDRVLAGLSIVTCQRVGLPRIAGTFMFNLLKEMKFYLVTGFGQSAGSLNNNQEGIHGQGVLQGSSFACPIYILTSDVCLSTYQKLGTGSAFYYPIHKNHIKDTSVQFVDDTSHFLNPLGADLISDPTSDIGSALLPFASENSQIWADSLWISGGKLNTYKCIYYAFLPIVNFKKNSIKYIDLPMPDQIRIRNRQNNTIQPIETVRPDESCHMLGVFLSPEGDGTAQLKKSLARAKDLLGKFKNSSMSSKAKWAAVTMVIKPAILYPLLTLSYSQSHIAPIDSILSKMKCATLGLNRNFPRMILHGPPDLGGMGISSIHQRTQKI